MKKIVLIPFLFTAFVALSQQPSRNDSAQKTILAIGAHPDDEIVVGGEVLVKYARLGYDVFC